MGNATEGVNRRSALQLLPFCLVPLASSAAILPRLVNIRGCVFTQPRVVFDNVSPIFINFADLEFGRFLKYPGRHPQALPAALCTFLATTAPLYAGYSTVWQVATNRSLRRAFETLYDSGQLSLYTNYPSPAAHLDAVSTLFSYVRETHSFYFGAQAEKIGQRFESPINKVFPTTPLLHRGMSNWSEMELTHNGGSVAGKIAESGLQLRREEAITRDLFAKTSGLPDAHPGIDSVALEIQRMYLGIYLAELRGLLISGLRGCSELDNSFPYSPLCDFQLLAHCITATLGRRVLVHPGQLLAATAELRHTEAQVQYSETIESLLIALNTHELRSDTPPRTLDQLRKRVLGRLARVLPHVEQQTGSEAQLGERHLRRAADQVREALGRFETKNGARSGALLDDAKGYELDGFDSLPLLTFKASCRSS